MAAVEIASKEKVNRLSRNSDRRDLKWWIRKSINGIWSCSHGQDTWLYIVSDEEDLRKFTWKNNPSTRRGDGKSGSYESWKEYVYSQIVSESETPSVAALVSPSLILKVTYICPTPPFAQSHRLTEFSTRGMKWPGEMCKYLEALRLTWKEKAGNWFAFIV